MADLVTRLLLQNNQFDKNLDASGKKVGAFNARIDKSKLSVNDFASKISSIGISSLAKFAGGIGLAVTAGEGLGKMMRSNQTTSDLFDNNLNAAKDSVDAFFRSLTTGDWTVFQDGIIGTFDKLKNLSAMMDELADKKLSLGYIKAEDLRDIEKFEQIAKDTNRTLAERKDAAQNMQGVVNHLNKKTRETIDFQMKTLNESYASKSGLKIDTGDLDYFVKNTNFDGGLTSQANEAYKTYVKLNNEAEKLKASAVYDRTTYGYDPERKYQKQYKDAQAAANAFNQENEFIIKQGWLTEEVDDKRKELVNTLIEQLNAEKEIYTLQKKVDKTTRTIDKQSSTNDAKANSEREKKDKQEFEFQNLKTNIEYGIKAEIYKIGQSAADSSPIRITLKPEYVESEETTDIKGSVADYQQRIQSVTLAYNEATTDGLRALYAKQREDLEKHLEEMTDMNQGMIDISNELQSLIQSGVVSGFESLGEAIGSGDPAEAMRNMLMGLMDMLKQFGAALVAAGMAKIAFDKLLANPYAAIAAGGALIIATSVAKSALQKSVSAGDYAEGGTVPYFTVGDRMTANVNGGEMILTTGQQAKLFDLLDLGRSQINNDRLEVTGRLVGEGSNLYAVLDTYTKKQRRGR